MSASNKTMNKSKQGHPPPDPIDWTLPAHFSDSDVRKDFDGVLLCLKEMGPRRWPAWEKLLLEYGDWSPVGAMLGLKYAREIVRRRWSEFEPVLIRRRALLAEYLEWSGFAVGSGPLESLILGSNKYKIEYRAHAAYLYAAIILKGRWEDGEGVILEAAGVADHAYIASQVAEAYRKMFFPRRVWPALQERIREGRCTPGFVVEYSRITGKKCNKDANEGLLKADRNADGFMELLWEYADVVLGGKLPDELHSAMMLKSFANPDDEFVKEYVRAYGQ
jgi:hypothetical protein